MNGKPLDYICCEIDSPEYSKAEIKKYLYFWNKNNFRHIDFEYIQPALSADQKSVSVLWFTISSQKAACPTVPSRLIIDVLYDYIKYAMCIDDPDQCPEFIRMTEKLLSDESVTLTPII